MKKNTKKEKKYSGPNVDCPACGAPPAKQEVRNHSAMWGDGEVCCKKCGTFVRFWDSG